MLVIDAIKILEKWNPNQRIGIVYHTSGGSQFNDDLEFKEITIDSYDEIVHNKSKFPFTKVLEIS